MMAPPVPQPQPTASSSSSTVKHFERYFAPAEVEYLTTVARGKQSIRQAEGTRLAACAFAEFVGARLGL
jgi:CTD kinase subunit beta